MNFKLVSVLIAVTNQVTMSDPLTLLRQYTLSRSEIIEQGDALLFGDLSYPKNTKTNYAIHNADKNAPTVGQLSPQPFQKYLVLFPYHALYYRPRDVPCPITGLQYDTNPRTTTQWKHYGLY